MNCQLEEQVGSIYTALVSPIFALSSLHLSKFQWIYSRIIYARTEGLALYSAFHHRYSSVAIQSVSYYYPFFYLLCNESMLKYIQLTLTSLYKVFLKK